jgi:hypothetical protein
MAVATLTLKKLLQNLRARLADDLNWGQGFDAQDMVGLPVATLGSDACKWTLMGAIVKEAPHLCRTMEQSMHNRELQAQALRALGFKHPEDAREFNDVSTHTDVLARIDQALAAQPKRGSAKVRDPLLDEAVGSSPETAPAGTRARRARTYTYRR